MHVKLRESPSTPHCQNRMQQSSTALRKRGSQLTVVRFGGSLASKWCSCPRAVACTAPNRMLRTATAGPSLPTTWLSVAGQRSMPRITSPSLKDYHCPRRSRLLAIVPPHFSFHCCSSVPADALLVVLTGQDPKYIGFRSTFADGKVGIRRVAHVWCMTREGE